MMTVASDPALPELIADLRLRVRRRQDFLKAEGNLTRQMKSIVARYLQKTTVTTKEVNSFRESEALAPLFMSREMPRAARHQEEQHLVTLVEQLPVYNSFWKHVHGLGPLGLAQIIGEAGNLSNYSTPAKLWRRFGLHPVNGRALSTWRVRGGLSAKDWEAAGYSPERRSIMHVITESLCKKRNEFKALCDQRKAIELQKAAAEGLTVAPQAKIPKADKDRYRSLGHIQKRAMRYVGKRLLRNLWRAWRDSVNS